jgi:hypothetical protein
VESDSPSDSNPTKQITANCPSGKRVLGGGSQISGDGKQYVADNGSYPTNSGGSFTGEAQEVINTPQNWQLKVYAVRAAVQT